MKSMLTLALAAALSISSAAHATPPMSKQDTLALMSPQEYLATVEKNNPSVATMLDLVASQQADHCQVPYTTQSLDKIANKDVMVAVGTALITWVSSDERPVYLAAMNATFDCDSEQWHENFRHHVTNSMGFKAQIESAQAKH